MRFSHYSSGSIVAYAFDDQGTVGLRYPDGRGLLRTSDGIPRSVVEHDHLVDAAAILACIAEDLDEGACERRGVAVIP